MTIKEAEQKGYRIRKDNTPRKPWGIAKRSTFTMEGRVLTYWRKLEHTKTRKEALAFVEQHIKTFGI